MNQSSSRSFRIGAPLSGEPHPVLQWIEVASFLQIPNFHIIGLPSPEVAEARERVRAAIEACGLDFPRRRVVINLSPASIRKRGTGVDLAMALAILHDTYGLAPISGHASMVAWGELGLNGTIKPARQLTRAIYAAWEAGADLVIVSQQEYLAAVERMRWISEAKIFSTPPPRLAPASNLMEAWDILRGRSNWNQWEVDLRPALGKEPTGLEAINSSSLLPLPLAMERVIGVAAAGSHHVMLLGSRGTGKSHALDWLVALQPQGSPEMRVRQSLMQELRGDESEGETAARATYPIRRVSAQTRPAALLGGSSGNLVRPGEFSLAHGGLLIADEFPEWPRDSREALREPLERGVVTLTRTRQTLELPARFTLAANGNLCPCGGWPREFPIPLEIKRRRIARCDCAPGVKSAYLARLSGPIMDRMDLVLMVAGIGAMAEARAKITTSSERLTILSEKTLAARAQAVANWGEVPGRLSSHELERILSQHPEWQEPMDPARFSSLRARHKVLRVALTLAAWDGRSEPSGAHFIESAFYRPERLGLGQ